MSAADAKRTFVTTALFSPPKPLTMESTTITEMSLLREVHSPHQVLEARVVPQRIPLSIDLDIDQ